MHPLRIAVLCEFGTLHGGEYSLLAALQALAPQVTPVLLAPGHGPLSEELDRLGIERIAFSVRHSDGTRRASSELTAELNTLLRQIHPDLLHGNSLSMGRLIGETELSKTWPTSAHLRDIMRLSRRAVMRLCQNHCLLAVSEATRDYHVQQGVRPELCHVLYNGIDHELFRPVETREARQALRREFGFGEEHFLILTIGQISLRKGHDVLAQAAPAIVQAIPETQFVVIGSRISSKQESREFDRRIDASFEAAGLSSRLHRIGWSHRIADWLRCTDVLVHPAHQEPLGRVLLEAASTQTPIVATHVGGTPEILTDGLSGLLFPAGAARALADCVIRLHRDPQLREQLGQSARKTILARFDIQERAEELLSHWKQTIAARHR